MAERRMFTQKIVDSDAFLDIPLTAQALYFHLNMRADDDGFINSPKKIQKMIGAADSDLKMLIEKRFLLSFENGIVVVKHWRMHNLLRKDRYKPTQYIEQKEMLILKENGSYTEKKKDENLSFDFDMATNWQPNDNQMATQYSIGKNSKGKVSIGKNNNISSPTAAKQTKHKYGEYKNVLLTDDEYSKLKERFPSDYSKKIENLSEGIALKGYKYKSHYLAVIKWADNEKQNNVYNGQADFYDTQQYEDLSY